MLDESEYAEIWQLYGEGIRATKEYREKWGVPLHDASSMQRMVALLVRYEQMTGYKETVANAVMHHRLSLYGPPCKRCSRPLRTPKAKLCGSCMFPVEQG